MFGDIGSEILDHYLSPLVRAWFFSGFWQAFGIIVLLIALTLLTRSRKEPQHPWGIVGRFVLTAFVSLMVSATFSWFTDAGALGWLEERVRTQTWLALTVGIGVAAIFAFWTKVRPTSDEARKTISRLIGWLLLIAEAVVVAGWLLVQTGVAGFIRDNGSMVFFGALMLVGVVSTFIHRHDGPDGLTGMCLLVLAIAGGIHGMASYNKVELLASSGLVAVVGVVWTLWLRATDGEWWNAGVPITFLGLLFFAVSLPLDFGPPDPRAVKGSMPGVSMAETFEHYSFTPPPCIIEHLQYADRYHDMEEKIEGVLYMRSWADSACIQQLLVALEVDSSQCRSGGQPLMSVQAHDDLGWRGVPNVRYQRCKQVRVLRESYLSYRADGEPGDVFVVMNKSIRRLNWDIN